MTSAARHPHSRQTNRSGVMGAAGPDRTATRPSGMGLVGLLTVLAAAWGGIAGYLGPTFGYRPTTSGSWQWTTTNWLLHLVPGAVGVVAGLAILARSPRLRAITRGVFGIAGLLAVAAGAWFIIGPALWPVFESSAAYGPASGDTARFVNELGANLGPGILLAVFGGMALKSVTRDRLVGVPAGPVDQRVTPAPAPVESSEAMAAERRTPAGPAPAAAAPVQDLPASQRPVVSAASAGDERGPVTVGAERPTAVEGPPADDRTAATSPVSDRAAADQRRAAPQANPVLERDPRRSARWWQVWHGRER